MTGQRLKKLISVHSAVILAVIIYIALPFKCPVDYFFHFPCPACGMTRAVFAALRLDFKQYFLLNPMALPFLALLLFAFHKDLFKIKKRTADIIIISGAVCVFIVYIVRLIFV